MWRDALSPEGKLYLTGAMAAAAAALVAFALHAMDRPCYRGNSRQYPRTADLQDRCPGVAVACVALTGASVRH